MCRSFLSPRSLISARSIIFSPAYSRNVAAKGSVFRHFCFYDNCKFQIVYPVFLNSRTLYMYTYTYLSDYSQSYSEDALRFRFQRNTRYRAKRSVNNVICIRAEIQARTRKISRERSSYREFSENCSREK